MAIYLLTISVGLLQLLGFVVILFYIRSMKSLVILGAQQSLRRNWHSMALLAAGPKNAPPLPPMDEWAACPDFVAEVVRAVRVRKPHLVVELGSGVSTVFLADAIRKNCCGRLISFDHDESFLNVTSKLLDAADLQDYCELRLAPLQVVDAIGKEWYSVEKFADIEKIDVLIVDGPPASYDKDIRRVTASVLGSRLSMGSSIYLDDSDREAERLAVEDWLKHHPHWTAHYFDFEKGGIRIDVGSVDR